MSRSTKLTINPFIQRGPGPLLQTHTRKIVSGAYTSTLNLSKDASTLHREQSRYFVYVDHTL